MTKHIIYLLLLLGSSTLMMAQNNAIFNGGSADGYNRDCYTQTSNLNQTLSKGGNGDGHSKDCYSQTSNLNTALSAGGNGDGHSKDCYTQISNLNTALSAGGSGDGYAKDCYIQASNLNNIFSGGIGGDGILNGCANEPLGCYLTLNLGNDTTFCTGNTLALNAGTYPGGATYLWQNSSTTQTFLVNVTGVYYVFVSDTAGCTVIDSITITVNPIVTPTFTAVAPICSGGSLSALPTTSNNGITGTWSPALNNTATTTYTFTPTAGLCATTTTITITVNPIVTTNLSNEAVCQGDSALIFGNYQTIAGNYYDTLTASTGCDSILVKQLILNPIYNQSIGTVTICQGDSALIFGNNETIAGTYSDTLTSINGCDSIVNQTLSVLSNSSVNFGNDTTFCAGNSLLLDAGTGNSYLWQDGFTTSQTYLVTSSGLYYVTVSVGACSATDSINITVNPIVITNLANVEICQGDSALIFGNFETIAGTYQDTLVSYTNCDSIVIQNLIINPIYVTSQNSAICVGDSILLGGFYQTNAGIYYDTLSTLVGCDSIIETTLSINLTYIVNANATICDGDSILLGGAYQTMVGIYNDTLTTIYGCDSLVTTTLMVNPIVQDTIAPIIICQGDSALLFGTYQSVAGTYQGFYSGSNTCDSIVSQDLIVNAPPIINLGVDTNLCETDSIYLDAGTNLVSYVWNTGDTTQVLLVNANTLSIGSYIYYIQGTDSNGCTSADSITIQISVCIGIIEQSDNLVYSLFPNPTKGEATLTSNQTIIGIEIFNMIGEKMRSEQVMKNSYQFNIEQFNKGVYFIRIEYEEGTRVARLVLN